MTKKTDVRLSDESRRYPTDSASRLTQHPRKAHVYKIGAASVKAQTLGVVHGESVQLESESPSIRRRDPLEKISLSRVHPATTIRCVASNQIE